MAIRPITFARLKYGSPLLADVAEVGALRGFIQHREPHALTFYEVMLVLSGRGELRLDGRTLPVHPGAVFVTAPGQVRSWRLTTPLRAEVAFFERDFAGSGLADRLTAGPLQLDASALDHCRDTLHEMMSELARHRVVSRARLIELCGHLPVVESAGVLSRRFVKLVDERFRDEQRVLDYAHLLGVTPEHLSRTTQRQLGCAASDVIHQRVLLEAQRRLLYTKEPVGLIADGLKFSDASYFCRFFKRGLGQTPRDYRASNA
ncbi:MAG: helix-turn-helix domain-containing protein [Deltaproteobacteria bacterium]|nr:helix-turn-helix domain-containing protein [Deltaproteobacteria bacterium]